MILSYVAQSRCFLSYHTRPDYVAYWVIFYVMMTFFARAQRDYMTAKIDFSCQKFIMHEILSQIISGFQSFLWIIDYCDGLMG